MAPSRRLSCRGDEFVLVGCTGDRGALGGDELLGVKQRVADLFEDVLVQLVGADVALRTAAVVGAGTQHIAVGTMVVTVSSAVTTSHPLSVTGHMTVAAPHQST